MYAIETTDLTKRYESTTAVEGLDLAIPEGVVYGFLGPNGAGKTTTMRMLTTLTNPTSGSAAIAGHSVATRDDVVDRIGYLPEEPPLYDELTGREQLDYIAGLRDIPADRSEERIGSLLDRFDLTADADDRISTYSKGMKRKTGIIQALLHDPEVVFLDEPTSGLDPRAARTVRNTIAELVAGDTTVFLAEGPPDALTERMETGEESTLEDVFLAVTGGREDAAPEYE
ncbi:ABC transporter ATP-binding protein [Halobacteriales archaeon QS_7_68_65]|nr:MAG: ABC transporter ATP-binding protein [Halobacteriales archaeon QS_7_68_65]